MTSSVSKKVLIRLLQIVLELSIQKRIVDRTLLLPAVPTDGLALVILTKMQLVVLLKNGKLWHVRCSSF